MIGAKQRTFAQKTVLVKTRTSIKRKGIIIKYLCFFASLQLFSMAEINGLTPFCFSAYIALVFCNQSVLILSPAYLLISLLNSPDLHTLLSSGILCAVMLLSFGLHRKFKKPIKARLLWVYALLGQGGYIYFCIIVKSMVIDAVMSLALGALFMYICTIAFSCVFCRGLKYKLNASEYASMAILLSVLTLALTPLTVYDIDVVIVFSVLMYLVAANSLGVAHATGVALAMGAGIALSSGQTTYMAAFALCALTACIFYGYSRYMSALSVIMVDIILGYFIGAYNFYGLPQVSAVALGVLLFLMIPKKWLAYLGEAIVGSSDKTAFRYIINHDRTQFSARLQEISGVFSQMEGVYQGMVSGTVDESTAKEMLCARLCAKLCDGCKMSGSCLGEFRNETARIFLEIMDAAIKKNGNATLVDLSSYITSRCIRLNGLVSGANQLAKEYNTSVQTEASLDNSKAMVSAHMGGISKILASLASDIKKPSSFDTARERQILQDLTYSDIIVSEAVVFEEGGSVSGATFVVKTDTINKSQLESITSSICRKKLEIVSIEDCKKAGFSLVNLVPSPKFDVVFGLAAVAKNNGSLSGDTHSFIRLGHDKFMLALSDGMGSGNTAQKISATAVSLVESFYRAGFDSQLILSGVNKLLAAGGGESFSAMDLCIVNLTNGQADLIKIGSPCSFIKRKQHCELINGSALPLGVLEEIRPSSSLRVLSVGDFVVLCTDGITDLMEENELCSFINNIQTQNPQALAETILTHCYNLCQSLPKDDMTVLAARLYEV